MKRSVFNARRILAALALAASAPLWAQAAPASDVKFSGPAVALAFKF
jgi:hypothetical protein